MYKYLELSNGKSFIIKDYDPVTMVKTESKVLTIPANKLYQYQMIPTPQGIQVAVIRMDNKQMNPVTVSIDEEVTIKESAISIIYTLSESSLIITDAIVKADAAASGISLV